MSGAGNVFSQLSQMFQKEIEEEKSKLNLF
jgi:hypothetical protein